MGLVGLSATQICGGEQTHARGRKPTLEARQGRRLRTPVESRPLPEAASTRRWSSTGTYSTGHAAGRSPGHGAGRPACRSLDRGDLDGDGDAAGPGGGVLGGREGPMKNVARERRSELEATSTGRDVEEPAAVTWPLSSSTSGSGLLGSPPVNMGHPVSHSKPDGNGVQTGF